MNTNDPFERLVAGYLADDAAGYASDRGLDDALAATSRIRPYPTWLADIKEPPMRIPARVVVGSPTLRLAAILALTLSLLLVVAAAVVGASLLPSPPVLSPFGPAANGSLAYERDGDIYLADADGGNARAVIKGPTADSYPWFSHDGRTLAFARESDGLFALMVADVDGSNVRELMRAADWNASFMPSGAEMVVTRPVADHEVLSMIDLASGEVRDLDLGGLAPNYWQMPRPPDGAEIIFRAETTKGGPEKGLYAIAPDGTGLRTIGAISATEFIDEDTGQNTQLSFLDPVVAPDGESVAYWNWEIPPGEAATDQRMHRRDLSTGEEMPVASSSPHVEYAKAPVVSPDGSMVVFESNLFPGTRQQLFLAPSDGSGPSSPIGPAFSYADRQGLEFSPDGTKIILSLGDNSGSTSVVTPYGVSIIDVTTGESTLLTDVPTMPSWQRVAP